MSFLTFDVETVPQAQFLDWHAPKVRPDRSWLERTELRDVELEARSGTMPLAGTGCAPALHPTTCEVVQVSFGWRQDGAVQVRLCQRDGYASEAELLVDAFSVLASASAKRTRLVSFNGKQFDVPILRGRAALLRLKVPALPWRRLLYPYSDDQHADLRLILGADDRRARGTLQWWAEAFGIHAEEHGAEVHAWVQAGEWDKLRLYGETEAKTLVELFEAVEPVL